MELPKFRYIEKCEDVLTISEKPVKCDCCGKETRVFASTMYTQQNVNSICVECIQSGLACEKFDGTFNNVPEIDNESAVLELSTKTPPLPTYQEIDWPDCCNDFCKFLRIATKNDLKNAKILNDLEETFDDDVFEVDELQKMNPNYLLLFQCTKCGKHYVEVDLD